MADDILEQLRKGGRLETAGEFRLDPEKAREKLRHFRLPDPHRWVLELVSAANLLGARELQLRIDADEVDAFFDAVFEPAQLSDFFNAAFREATTAADHAARQLAIGVTAAEALRPALLSIHSGANRLHLAPGKPRLEAAPTIGGTKVYFKEAFRAGHVIDFLKNIGGDTAEKSYLKRFAQHSTTKVVLDGKSISHGLKIPGLPAHALIDTSVARGQASVTAGPSTRVHLVQHGVLIQTEVTQTEVGVDMVLDCPGLQRDMSNASFVRDEAYQALLERIDESRNEALFHFLEAQPNGVWSDHRFLVDLTVRTLERIVELRHKELPVPYWLGKLGGLLEDAVIWPRADRPADTHVPLGEIPRTSLAAVRRTGKIYFSTRQFAEERVEKKTPVLLFTKRHILELTMAEIAAFLGLTYEDVTAELESLSKATHNRAAWKHKPWPTEIPHAQFAFVWGRSEGPVSVQVGITQARGGVGYGAWVKEKWLLRRHAITRDLPLEVLIAGDFEASKAFDGPAIDASNVGYAKTAILLFQEMFEERARTVIGEPDERLRLAARAYFAAAMNGTFHAEILTTLGLESVARQLFEELAVPGSVLVLHNHETLGLTLDSVLDSMGILADFQVFERLDGRGSHSLRELVLAAEKSELFVVKEQDSSRLFALGSAIPEGTFIWTTPELDRALHHLFGNSVKPGIDRVLSTAWYTTYLNRPVMPFGFENESRFHAIKSSLFENNEIQMAWREPGAGSRARFYVRYFFEERVVEDVDWPAYLGEFWVNVRGADIEPNKEHGKLDRNKAASKIEIQIKKLALQVVLEWVDEQLELPDELRHAEFLNALRLISEKDRKKFLEIKFLNVAGGARISPEMVDEHFGGVIPFVTQGQPLPALVPPNSAGVLAEPEARLRALFPQAVLVDCTAHDQKVEALHRAVSRFLARPKRQLVTSPEAITEVVDEQSDLTVRLWMFPDPDPSVSPSFAPIDVFFQQRPLCELSVAVPFGRFSAVVTGAAIVPDVQTYDRVASGAAEIEARVFQVAERAVFDLGERPEFFGLVRHYLAVALKQGNTWPEARDFLRRQPIFVMADQTRRSYEALDTMARHHGLLPWARPGENVAGAMLSEIVILDDQSAHDVNLFPHLPWKHVQSMIRATQPSWVPPLPTGGVKPQRQYESLGRVLEAVQHLVEGLETDYSTLLGAWGGHLTPAELGFRAPLLAVGDNQVTLNVNHPVGKAAITGDVSTAPYIASALLSLLVRTVFSIDSDAARQLHLDFVRRLTPARNHGM